ncbi:MAG: sigma-70 family RNA polymerase sigma factor [Planctomycetes bacterium]|nr:sigma-70 family RNA polymerase sigma factor [Planctomycetota bacterium]
MAPAREMTDQDLLRAYVHSQDVDSLGVFLGRYEGPLMRFVANFLRDESAAQDIVQETFLRVAKKPSKLLDVSSCHNWLLKIARNLSIDHLRRLARNRKHSRALEYEAARSAAAAVPSIDRLEKSERMARVRSEIDRLRPRLRMVMLLKVQEGKSYREIAEITGLTTTNVGYLIHQAMKTLKTRLEDLREASS